MLSSLRKPIYRKINYDIEHYFAMRLLTVGGKRRNTLHDTAITCSNSIKLSKTKKISFLAKMEAVIILVGTTLFLVYH